MQIRSALCTYVCALNAVANAMTIPMELYEDIKKNYPELKRVFDWVDQAGIAKNFEESTKKLARTSRPKCLTKSRAYLFAVRFGIHCLTYLGRK